MVKRPRMERVVTRSADYANFVRKTRLKSWHMLHRLKGDRRGTTAVEFALTARACHKLNALPENTTLWQLGTFSSFAARLLYDGPPASS